MQSRQSTGTKTTATSAPPPIARPADSALHVARQSSSSIVAVSSTTSHAHVGGGDGDDGARGGGGGEWTVPTPFSSSVTIVPPSHLAFTSAPGRWT